MLSVGYEPQSSNVVASTSEQSRELGGGAEAAELASLKSGMSETILLWPK